MAGSRGAFQSFPPGMEFAGDLTSKYKQIGNAVPVQLASEIATNLRIAMERRHVA